VALPIPPRGLQRHWSAVMPKDLAKADYVAAFIDLLARGGPAAGARTGVTPITQVRPQRRA
jgi:hypothetical protein